MIAEVQTQKSTLQAPTESTKPQHKGQQKQARQVPHAHVYIQASFNNTIVTVADQNGDALGWASSGMTGFKGPKKATPYAAGQVVKRVVDATRIYGVREANVFVKGIGGGREGAIRALNINGITVLSIKDITPIPHNGCRPAKRRRV